MAKQTLRGTVSFDFKAVLDGEGLACLQAEVQEIEGKLREYLDSLDADGLMAFALTKGFQHIIKTGICDLSTPDFYVTHSPIRTKVKNDG